MQFYYYLVSFIEQNDTRNCQEAVMVHSCLTQSEVFAGCNYRVNTVRGNTVLVAV